MSYILPDLDFSYDALEPHIDKKTMRIHHLRHHATYLEKFNKTIEGTDLEDKRLMEIFSEISRHSNAVRNNGGGFYNHTLFWQMLSPEFQDIENQNLLDTIVKFFGTKENLQKEFSDVAANQFGSGWAWLIKRPDGELLVTSTPNQDNPYMDIVPIKGKPILCLDVWEHAYYLKYQNKRKDYISAFWNVVNWKKVAELFNE